MSAEYESITMHIPDGYLSPATCVAAYAVMAPVWYAASRRAEGVTGVRELPLLALGAAFVFVVMMLNIPVPGGTAGHMSGTVVIAIMLGPWAAVVAVSLVLALQALLFGDGGITTLAANCFNMAFVMSFAGYLVYRLGTIGSAGAARRLVAAGVAGYVAVNLAALAAAVELGIQPALASTPEGLPLYSPYPMGVTVPAMMLSHLLFFGAVEAVGTGLIASYLGRMGIGVNGGRRGAEGAPGPRPAVDPAGRPTGLRPAYMAMAALVVVTPAGLIATGAPWGEWGTGELAAMVGYLPEGLGRMSAAWGAWKGLLPGYSASWAAGPVASALVYVLSALLGSAGVVCGVYAWGRLAGR